MKRPVSVLVLVHTPQLDILVLERAGHPGFWQSVTGSHEEGETLESTAYREVLEETGINARQFELTRWNQRNRFEIFGEWRHRYPTGTTHNLEHVFSLKVPFGTPVQISVEEHRNHRWLPWRDAADAVFSWTNRDAIICLAITC